jgi:methylenetetrahydrofolate--tRNA-(uracil-5-)-methyltransferase
VRLTIVGGGLSGCEAAWQASRFGVDVDLYEMRPQQSGPAHVTANLAELVCSNSFRGAALENAVGLLKEELATLGSLIVGAARATAVPAGGALAVDRERFSALVESKIASNPRIALRREELQALPENGPVIIACGPLPTDAFLTTVDALLAGVSPESERRRLHYYDAASPIVSTDSLDLAQMYRKSRWDKKIEGLTTTSDDVRTSEDGDYLNVPLDRAQYGAFVHDLRTLERHPTKEFEAAKYFEGCLPIEEMADRGDDVLRFGPLKPVGLLDPRHGRVPFAVVQLRKENAEGTAYNIVGFQTRLTWPSQRIAFAKLPGLQNAEWLRLGVMHRNTFIDSPRLLDERLRLRGERPIYFAGQITGAEGYVEAAACGMMTGVHAAREMLGLPPVSFPRESAFGAVVAHLQNRHTADFQPANVTWGAFPSLDCAPDDKKKLGKKERRRALAMQAVAAIERFAAETAAASSGYCRTAI